MWGGGLSWSKKATLSTWEGGRPLFNRRGDGALNLLGGGLFANFLFVLGARAGARGSRRIGGGGVIVWVEVTGGEGGHIICASSVFTGLVAVWVQPGILLGVPERLAKPGIAQKYEVFRVLISGGSWCGWCLSPFLPLP